VNFVFFRRHSVAAGQLRSPVSSSFTGGRRALAENSVRPKQASDTVILEAVMQETTRQSIWQASVIGVAFVLAGVAALWAGLDPSAADALSKFWPTGVIGIGVALILGNGQG
jgi:hypothetical protein